MSLTELFDLIPLQGSYPELSEVISAENLLKVWRLMWPGCQLISSHRSQNKVLSINIASLN